MRHLFTKYCLAIAIGVLAFDSATAAVLYSQTNPAKPTSAFASNDSSPTNQRVADNFLLAGSVPRVVRSVRFIGGRGPVNPPQENFRIVFLEDAGGLPGNPVQGGDFEIGAGVSRTPAGGPLLNGVTLPQEYVANLPNGIELNPNNAYWISITNDLLPVTGWTWARANGNLDSIIATTSNGIAIGPWTTGISRGGMWFELSDQLIPEPSSLCMILLTLAAMAATRTRLNSSESQQH